MIENIVPYIHGRVGANAAVLYRYKVRTQNKMSIDILFHNKI